MTRRQFVGRLASVMVAAGSATVLPAACQNGLSTPIGGGEQKGPADTCSVLNYVRPAGTTIGDGRSHKLSAHFTSSPDLRAAYPFAGPDDELAWAAIQAALDANPGRCVYLPAGTYLVNRPCTVHSATTVHGDGYGSQIAIAADLGPTEDQPTPIAGILYVENGAANVDIHSLRLAGFWDEAQNNLIYRASNILLGSNTANCRVFDCWSERAGWSGILARGRGHQIFANHCSGCAVDGIEIWGSQVVVAGNWCYSNGYGYRQPNHGVAGIEVTGPGGESISHIAVRGNYLERNYYGIVSAGGTVDGLSITGNHIRDSARSAVYLNGDSYNGSHIQVAGNIIDGTQTAGGQGNGVVVASHVSHFVVTGNVAANVAARAIAFSIAGDAGHGIVTNNLVELAQESSVGLLLAEHCHDVSVGENVIRAGAPGAVALGNAAGAGNRVQRGGVGFLAAGEVTPSVGDGAAVYRAANTVPIVLSGLAGGYPGQTVTVVMDGKTTVNFGGSYVAFRAGGRSPIEAGNRIIGMVSGARALVAGVEVTDGAWSQGSAAGRLYLQDLSGNLGAEDITVGGGTRLATLTAPPAPVNLRGNGGQSWSPPAGDHMTCVFDGASWYCQVSHNAA